MKKLLDILPILLLCFVFWSCSNQKPNPKAIVLNNQALALGFDSLIKNERDSVYLLKKAINILNKALKIDSTYLIAYSNKLNFQLRLREIDSAFVTGKQMIKLNPNDGMTKCMVGEVYEKYSDSTKAFNLYNIALSEYDQELVAKSIKDKDYKKIEVSKAVILILLNRSEEGHNIFKSLLSKEPEGSFKEQLKFFIDLNKHDLLYGRTNLY